MGSEPPMLLWHDARMNEGVAAVLAAVIAVVGVGLGLFGARWQYRAALEQANAAVRAANAQAQAAIEAVKAQGRDQNAHWRRTLRREVWVSFIAAIDALEEATEEVTSLAKRDDFEGALRAMAVVRQRRDDLRKPMGDIELEGPEVIFRKALAVGSIYQSASQDLEDRMKDRAALQRVRQLREAGSATASQFFDLVEQLPTDSTTSRDHLLLREQIRSLDLGIPRADAHRALRCATSLPTRFNPWFRAHTQRSAFVAAARAHLDGE